MVRSDVGDSVDIAAHLVGNGPGGAGNCTAVVADGEAQDGILQLRLRPRPSAHSDGLVGRARELRFATLGGTATVQL